ncbi:unnamed protein product, partial [Prorocentrum cordatum]
GGKIPCVAALRDHWRWFISPECDACTRCFKGIAHVGKKALTEYKRYVINGHTALPEETPGPNPNHQFRVRVQEDHCDSWLNYIYHFLAEHRADIKAKRLSMTPGVKAATGQAHVEHVRSTFRGRAVCARLDRMCEESCRGQPHPEPRSNEDSLLTLYIDGMDQAKFRVPRNLEATKEFEKCWRPDLHVVCVLVPGLTEQYYIMNTDLAKDANMEATLVAHALDLCSEALWARGRRLPAHLQVFADNTTREARNQHFFMFLSSLVSKQIFRSAAIGSLQVGHTHNCVDRRFSVISTELARQEILETPE